MEPDQDQDLENPMEPEHEPEQAFVNPDAVLRVIDLDDDNAIEEDDEDDGVDEDGNETNKLDDGDESILEYTHPDSVFTISTFGDIALTGDASDRAYLWNWKTGETIGVLEGHTDSVVSASFSHDGKYIATAAMDGTVRVYLAADRTLLHNLEVASSEVEWMDWHPSGPIILVGGSDASVSMWHAVSGTMMQAFTGHRGSVLAGGFTSDGKVICTGGEDLSVKIWNPKTGVPIHNLKNLHSAPITTIACHPSQRLLMSCDAAGTTKVVNIDSGKVVLTLGGHTDGIEAAGFSATHKLCATGSLDGTVRVWDLTNGSNRDTCVHPEAITKLIWHPSHPIIYTSCMDGKLRAWESRSGVCLHTWPGHSDAILYATLDSTAEHLLTASDDHTALVFRTNFATSSKTSSSA